MKTLSIYKYVERCDPNGGAYHEGGGLVIITSGDPNDAVPEGTGDPGDGGTYGLPVADLTIPVPEDTPDAVFVFPDAGCC